jgi:hypothetical protein
VAIRAFGSFAGERDCLLGDTPLAARGDTPRSEAENLYTIGENAYGVFTRRRVLVRCGSLGAVATAGCLDAITAPDIPREHRLLDTRTTVAAGGYRAWSLGKRMSDATTTPVDEGYVFSYEFTVERGPAVSIAVTDAEELDRRERTAGQYQVFSGTRAHGREGAATERMARDHLDLLVVDNQYIGPETPATDRAAAIVHVRAYLSTGDDATES